MGPFNWAFNWMLQVPPQEPGPPPLPDSGTGTSTPSFSCVGVTLEQLQTHLAALKTDILNVVATNSALQSVRNEILTALAGLKLAGDCAKLTDLAAAKAEILAAIADIQASPPDPNAGYAMVGGTKFAKLADAAAAVPVNGVVEIHGVMQDMNATTGFQRSCTIRGMTPDAKLEWTLGTSERMALGKGLIVCQAVDPTSVFVIENLELTGARVIDRNGAGVRGDGCASVTVRNCNIHDNENGVLSIATRLVLEGNTFLNNGNGAGNAHGVYANSTGIEEVIAEGNTFGKTLEGNHFKSRAKRTVFRRNMVAELDGTCSWQVDLSNGGDCLVEKNVIEQGPNAANRNIVSYGPEGIPADGRVNSLAFRDNWVINDHALDAWGLTIFNLPATLEIARNTFVGQFAAYVNAAMDATNLTHADRAAAGLAAYPSLPGVPA
jgi:hypothetical protein